jgi:hypothetical protein
MTFSNLTKLLTFIICTISVCYCQGQCDNDTIAPTGNIIDISSVVLGSVSYEAEIYADNHSNRILISENPSPHFIEYRMGDVR